MASKLLEAAMTGDTVVGDENMVAKVAGVAYGGESFKLKLLTGT